MAYEVVIYLEPVDATKVIELFNTEGAEAALRELRLYHWQGHHQIIADSELEFGDGDIVINNGDPYLGWINPDKYEAGLFYKLPH